ncbi:YihY/virulence factor BrkB family protein [Quadrisphaera sp. DSM 44207]|uniref:YihY/virulence factor BrkB family protein n=1 Tax=Quadrisphaera sp. DSM 44207 TaxID=1881057 RepID=UPI0008878C41|nr:YihY/virulence factor BrkB family protein [Quadrisphaera sp. DSM 44207]SDQ13426.1 membrane protein [Quadrisphaera sp. DSM 44207]
MTRSAGGAARTGPPGVDAGSPVRIPARGWGQVLQRAGQRLLAERFPLLSAGIAFFALLSLAPVLLTALSIYGAVTTPEEALAQLSGVAGVLPPALQQLVADQLTTITAASAQVLTVRGLSGLVVALWTATTAATYLIDALTLAYHEEETRGLLRRTGLGLAFVLGGALLLGGVLTAAGVASPVVAGAPQSLRAAAEVLVWVVLAALMVAVLSALYRLAPDRRRARWRWITGGAAVATALWVATSVGLFAYVQGLGTYETTYGSLAGVAISMFWVWVTVLLVLVGAVVDAEAERQTARDSTVGPERPLGQREAVVADSAPPYPQDAGG